MEKKLSWETVFMNTTINASLFDQLGGCDDEFEFAHFIGELILFYLKQEENLYELLDSYDVLTDRRIAKQLHKNDKEIPILVEMPGALFNELQEFCEDHHFSTSFVVNMAVLEYFDEYEKSEQFHKVYGEVYAAYVQSKTCHRFDDMEQFRAYKNSLPANQAKYANKDYWYRYDSDWEIDHMTREKIKKMNQ